MAPDFVRTVLGLRRGQPNTADTANPTSVAIAQSILQQLGLDKHEPPTQNEGRMFERGVADYIGARLRAEAPDRGFLVFHKGKSISDFEQYRHLAELARKVATDETLRVEMGPPSDYLITPDVTVGIEQKIGGPWDAPFLHATISCKWTIRSDRVQNIRHEAVLMARHRRGRLPHIVAATLEPLPTRLASIARGTGEVDAVYHAAFEELVDATTKHGTQEQRDCLGELVNQRRLFPLADLVATLLET